MSITTDHMAERRHVLRPLCLAAYGNAWLPPRAHDLLGQLAPDAEPSGAPFVFRGWQVCGDPAEEIRVMFLHRAQHH